MTEIDFEGSGVPVADRPELDSALRKLVDPANPRPWRRAPDRITVRRKLSGLGGATVLEVLIDRDPKVVKVDTVEEMRREYTAHRTVIEPARTDLCPAIEAVTPRVGDHSLPDVDEREVIVYTHLAHYIGEPDAPLTTLEDVFARASQGDTDAAVRATRAVASVLTRAHQAFYANATALPRASLRTLANTLGPDLTVEAEPAGAGAGDPRLIYESHVSAAGTFCPGASAPPDADPPVAGQRIRITGLRRRGNGSVAERGVATIDVAGGSPGPTFDVTGRVVHTRPTVVMQRLRTAVDGLREGPGVIEAPGVVAAHPFASLHLALFTRELSTVRSPVHGDLNSRNVLLVDSPHGHTPTTRPYLIDYARATNDGDLLADFAWLEINLIRAVGGAPNLADLVRLHRFLTAVAWLFPLSDQNDRSALAPVTGADGAVIAHLRTATPELATIWPVLARLRWEAWRSYPREHRDAWFADYNRHLTVAAHRTFKWPDAQQSPLRWAASAATAAVAAEWFDPTGAFRNWPEDDLAALVLALPLAIGPAGAAAATILGSVTAELDRRRTANPPVHAAPGVGVALAEVADRVAASVVRRPAAGPVRPFIDLGAAPADLGAAPPSTGDAVSAATLMTREPFVFLVGPADSGKSTVVQVLVDRMLTALTRPARVHAGEHRRLPIMLPVRDVVAAMADGDVTRPVGKLAPVDPRTDAHVADLLRGGCLHLLVDGIVDAGDLPAVVAWAGEIRARHPSTPVTIASRIAPDTAHSSPTGESATVYRLLPPTTGQAVEFLTEWAALGNLPVHRVRSLLLGPDTRISDELLDSPLFLGMLAAHLRPDAAPPTVGDLLDQHFAHPPVDHDIDRGRWEGARRMAAVLAAHLVDSGVDAIADTAEPGWLDPPDRAGWPNARAVLVSSGVLRPASTDLTFARPVFRDFHAAADLARRPDLLAGRARRLRWQEPLRLAVSRSGASPDLRTAAVSQIRRTDPAFAGRLLVAAPGSEPDAAESFATEQLAVLADDEAGRALWRRAARALIALGGAHVRALHAAIADRGRPAAARLTALQVLSRAVGTVEPALPDPSPLIAALLADLSTPPDLRVAAVALAEKLRATRLAVLIADGCRPDAPWGYVRAAHTALRTLDVPIPPTLQTAYLTAVRTRLAELERDMPTLTAVDQIRDAGRDWFTLLRATTAADLDHLLRYRFGFELGRLAGEALDHVVASGLDSGHDAARLLTGATADEALTGFTAGVDDRLVTAAAHRLLSIAPERAGELLARTTPDASPARLRAAAHAAAHAGRPSLPLLDGFARSLLDPPYDQDRAGALAVVMSAVAGIDPVDGARLAERVRGTLAAAQAPTRLRWPLRTALARYALPPALAPRLLGSPATEDRALGIAGLSTYLFHLDAAPAPAIRLDATSLDALRSAQPPAAATWPVVDFVRAAATARLTSALGLIHDLLAIPELATMVREVPYANYGPLVLTGLSEVLTAGGFLARQALLGDDRSLDGVAGAVAERIIGLATGGRHESVAAARLVALAQLGDPDPLLRRLDEADDRLHIVARRAVVDLAPDGPCGSEVWRDPVRARDVVADLLYHGARTAEARTTLADILDALVQRTGELPAIREAS